MQYFFYDPFVSVGILEFKSVPVTKSDSCIYNFEQLKRLLKKSNISLQMFGDDIIPPPNSYLSFSIGDIFIHISRIQFKCINTARLLQ